VIRYRAILLPNVPPPPDSPSCRARPGYADDRDGAVRRVWR
jgi:hypothetical protein